METYKLNEVSDQFYLSKQIQAGSFISKLTSFFQGGAKNKQIIYHSHKLEDFEKPIGEIFLLVVQTSRRVEFIDDMILSGKKIESPEDKEERKKTLIRYLYYQTCNRAYIPIKPVAQLFELNNDFFNNLGKKDKYLTLIMFITDTINNLMMNREFMKSVVTVEQANEAVLQILNRAAALLK